MPKLHDILAVAEEEVARKRAEREEAFEISDPAFFPRIPDSPTENLRQEMRAMALSSHYYMATVVLGYTKFRPQPQGELCAFMDFVEAHPQYNRTIIYSPRDTYKTSAATITRAIKRGCKDPNSQGLILADTSLNAIRFGMEIKNHFELNPLLRWLFPEVIPDNFNTARWNANELVLKRTRISRDPTYDMMGVGGGVESRHYDWILPDDLVTEKCIHSDTEMDKVTKQAMGLEPLLISDTEGRIDFVGSRKKKGDTYDEIEKYYGAGDAIPQILGPHAVKKGSIVVYSRNIYEGGKNIFPYDKDKKSGISDAFLLRLRTKDPQRFHAQYANSPKGAGLTLFRPEDIRYFTMDDSGIITAVHGGRVIEQVSIWSLQRIIMFDPATAKSASKRLSKQAIIVAAKGNGPNIYVLRYKVGHYAPDNAVKSLFRLNKEWGIDFTSIEERGFQSWVRATLDLVSELLKIPQILVQPFPPPGSERSQFHKDQHIMTLQPYVRHNLLWLRSIEEEPEMRELADDLEFYPNITWKDGLDALAQGTEWWPFSEDEAEKQNVRRNERLMLAERDGVYPLLLSGAPEGMIEQVFDEREFLSRLDSSGYGMRQVFNN
jgi:hypothetical protein